MLVQACVCVCVRVYASSCVYFLVFILNVYASPFNHVDIESNTEPSAACVVTSVSVSFSFSLSSYYIGCV